MLGAGRITNANSASVAPGQEPTGEHGASRDQICCLAARAVGVRVRELGRHGGSMASSYPWASWQYQYRVWYNQVFVSVSLSCVLASCQPRSCALTLVEPCDNVRMEAVVQQVCCQLAQR